MSDISLSKAVRSNLLSLQNTANLMGKTQDRLATGNKVNSALDNPTNFFTASALNSRAGDLGALLDSMANGIQTLEAADNGLSSITKTLESMQSTLRQARQDKSFETASLSIDAATIGTGTAREMSFAGGALDASQSVELQNTVKVGNAGFTQNGTAGVSGNVSIRALSLNSDNPMSFNFSASDTADQVAAKINERISANFPNSGVSASVVNGQLKIASSKGEDITLGTDAANSARYIGLAAGQTATVGASTAGSAVAGGALAASEITLNGEKIQISAIGSSAAPASTPQANAEAIRDQFNNSEVAMRYGITATAAATGVITFSQSEGRNFTIVGATAGVAASTTTANGVIGSGNVTAPAQALEVKTTDQLVNEINANADIKTAIRASNDNGKLRIQNLSTQELNLNGVSSAGTVDGSSTGATKIAGNSVRTSLVDQYNELRDQLDKLSDDASFNGINLLQGDLLRITFNETGTSEIDVQTKDQQALNAAKLDLFNLSPSDLDSDVSIDGLLSKVKEALSQVRSQASSFGQNLSIVENRQNFTKNMINTLETGGANLTLADMNEEAANLLALQTRQQLSSNSLSLASQADQSVLQLLQ